MLTKLFSSRVRVELLALLFLNPDRGMYTREIARAAGEDIKSISRELRNLEDMGLVSSRKEGNLKYYALRKDFLLFDELNSLILKTRGAAGALRDALAGVKDIDYAFIYGSIASGASTGKSDVDLMVVGEIRLENLLKVIKGPEEALGREINPSLYSLREFKARAKKKDPFIMRVLKEPKIMILGDDDDLQKIAG